MTVGPEVTLSDTVPEAVSARREAETERREVPQVRRMWQAGRHREAAQLLFAIPHKRASTERKDTFWELPYHCTASPMKVERDRRQERQHSVPIVTWQASCETQVLEETHDKVAPPMQIGVMFIFPTKLQNGLPVMLGQPLDFLRSVWDERVSRPIDTWGSVRVHACRASSF